MAEVPIILIAVGVPAAAPVGVAADPIGEVLAVEAVDLTVEVLEVAGNPYLSQFRICIHSINLAQLIIPHLP